MLKNFNNNIPIFRKKSSIIDVKLEEPPLLSLGPVLSPSFGPLVPPPVRGNPPRPPPFILIGGCG